MSPRRFQRALITLSVLTLPVAASACAVCYGDPSDPMTKGANLAIIAMLGVTGTVMGGVVSFFVYLMRRARRVGDPTCTVEPVRYSGRKD